MLEFICLFIPSVIASRIHINKLKVLDIEDKISLYLIYTFIINMVMFIILNYYCDNPYMIFDKNLFSYNFSMKYMIVSLVLALILPLGYIFIKNNFKITFKLIRRSK